MPNTHLPFTVCSHVTEVVEAPTAAAPAAASRGRLLLLLAPHLHAEPPGGVQLLRPPHPRGQERPLQAVQLRVNQERKALSECRSQNGQARGVRRERESRVVARMCCVKVGLTWPVLVQDSVFHPPDSLYPLVGAGSNYCQSHMFWWMLTVKKPVH